MNLDHDITVCQASKVSRILIRVLSGRELSLKESEEKQKEKTEVFKRDFWRLVDKER
jgi:hypothetical protein